MTNPPSRQGQAHANPPERTGRTTRMLNEALRLAREGRAVYVLAANCHHVYTLERMSDQLFGNGEASSLGIKFEVAHSLSDFDFETMTLRGAHPKCVVLVDHYTIECIYAKMLAELHRFDEPLSMHLVE